MSSFSSFFSKNKTFRKPKQLQEGTLRYQLHKAANATLQSGIDHRKAVLKPDDQSIEDWIAIHVVDFFNRINLIYGTISDYCTKDTCPKMTGGAKYEYHWCDGDTYKKPTAMPAMQYIGLLMDWVEHQLHNEEIFPLDTETPFPKNYMSTVKKLLTRMFRVFVHVYIHHFETVVAIGAEAHVNTCFKHFYSFVTEFSLVDKKELEPLKDMTAKLCR